MNGEITGRARLGRRTKDLVKRLGPQDVAIVDHADIDRVSAEELAESGVRAVVNVSRSSTGRYPNPGPLELVRAGVRLVDAPGAPLFDELADGELVRLDGGSVWRNGTLVAEGTVLDAASLEEALADQQGRVSHALEAFAENTLRHLQEEAGSLAAGIELPALRTRFRDRHVLVVARGPGYKSDLRMVRPYVRDFRPVLVAVDGGADALREVGLAAGRDRRRLRLRLGRLAAGGRRARRARVPERRGTGRGAAAGPRPAVPRRLGAGDQRGPRAATGLREGRDADRRRRHALQPRRVPRARPRGHGLDVRDAAQGGGVARRREGRLAPRLPPRRHLAARGLRGDRRSSRSSARSSPRRPSGT